MFKIRHTGIVTDNLKASLRFYRRLGLEIEKHDIEQGKFIDTILGKNGILLTTVKLSEKIELLKYTHRRGQCHIAFTVEDLDKEYKRLKKFNIHFISSPQISPDKKAKVVFCYSPTGTLIELVEDL